MKYEHDRSLFNAGQVLTIDLAIEDKISPYTFKIMTKIGPNGKPVFDADQMLMIKRTYATFHNEKYIDLIASCDAYGNASFNHWQMEEIYNGLVALDYDQVKTYAILKDNGKDIFSAAEMREIYYAYKKHLSNECIELITKTDKRKNPIYSFTKMEIIIKGFEAGLSVEDVNIFARTSKNGKPIFSHERMEVFLDEIKKRKLSIDIIRSISELIERDNFKAGPILISLLFKNLHKCNSKQIAQIIDGIKIGLSCNAIGAFDYNLDADSMRVLKWLAKNECESYILNVISSTAINLSKGDNKKGYEYLKNYKYYFQCMKILSLDTSKLKEMYPSLEENLVDECLVNQLCFKTGKFDLEREEILKKCFEFKMPLEQIEFIASAEYNNEEAKNLFIALLNGANFEKIKENHELASTVLNGELLKENTDSEITFIDFEERF